MQKLRYRSIGMAAILSSRSEGGLAAAALDRADDWKTAALVKERKAWRQLSRADGVVRRLAAGRLGTALSHLANCRHPRIWSAAMAWDGREGRQGGPSGVCRTQQNGVRFGGQKKCGSAEKTDWRAVDCCGDYRGKQCALFPPPLLNTSLNVNPFDGPQVISACRRPKTSPRSTSCPSKVRHNEIGDSIGTNSPQGRRNL